jgi:hypothetical protein
VGREGDKGRHRGEVAEFFSASRILHFLKKVKFQFSGILSMGYCLKCFSDVGGRKGPYCPECGFEYDHGKYSLTMSKTGGNPQESLENIEEALKELVDGIEESVEQEAFHDVESDLETSAEQVEVNFQLFSSSLEYEIRDLISAYYLALEDITGVDLGEVLMESSEDKPEQFEKIGFNVLNPRNTVKELFKDIFRTHDGTLGEYFKEPNKFCIINVPGGLLEGFRPRDMPREVTAFYNSLKNGRSGKVNKAVLSHEMTHAFLFQTVKKKGFDMRNGPNSLLLEEGAAWAITYHWTDELSPLEKDYPDELPQVIKMFSRYGDRNAEGKDKIDCIREKALKLILADFKEDGLSINQIEKALS